jgi:hypothetical protein
MVSNLMCGAGFGAFFSSAIIPLMAFATIGTATIIAFSYMLGNALSNAKLTLWAKTEVMQLFISLASVGLILFAVNTFCFIDMKEIADIFALSGTHASANIYDAASTYLNDSATYSHNAIKVVRYHLEAYTVLSYFNAFICDFAIGRIGLGCFFGYAGDTQQPFGGYSADIAALNVFFNTAIMAHFTVLNFLFILLFVYKGFVFLFLPLGVFLRAMPYMRPVGSLLIALALSFLTVYPFMLGVFYLMEDVLLDKSQGFAPLGLDMTKYDEKIFPDSTNPASQLAVGTLGEDYVKDHYFGDGREKPAEAIAFAAYAFIAAVFFPSVALLAAIASVSYMARLMGEEIDLSRITQLV